VDIRGSKESKQILLFRMMGSSPGAKLSCPIRLEHKRGTGCGGR